MTILTGQPNASQYHPDYMPSKFPDVYKQTQPSTEQSERMKHTFDRQLRVQQASIQEARKKQAEKESLKGREREERDAKRKKREEKKMKSKRDW